MRENALHQLTHHLSTHYAAVAIEDLNVRGMLANGKLARHLADASFGEFRRQLEYKVPMRGGQVLVVDRWYPSSKTCSACGAVHGGLTLAQRQWNCPACGAVHQRDENAARNILAQGLKDLAPGVGVSACGEESTGAARKSGVKLASVKQEVNHKLPKLPT